MDSRESKRKEHQLVNSCMCSYQGSNQQPWDLRMMLQPTEPRAGVIFFLSNNLSCSLLFTLYSTSWRLFRIIQPYLMHNNSLQKGTIYSVPYC